MMAAAVMRTNRPVRRVSEVPGPMDDGKLPISMLKYLPLKNSRAVDSGKDPGFRSFVSGFRKNVKRLAWKVERRSPTRNPRKNQDGD